MKTYRAYLEEFYDVEAENEKDALKKLAEQVRAEISEEDFIVWETDE